MKAVMNFGHHGTLIRLASLMGLFLDTPSPTGSNMAAMGRRRFRQSLIGSFAANLALVLYDCAPADAAYAEAVEASNHSHSTPPRLHAPRYCLELRYNERPLAWPPAVCGGRSKDAERDGFRDSDHDGFADTGSADFKESPHDSFKCPYDEVRSYFDDHMKHCNLDAICAQGRDEL